MTRLLDASRKLLTGRPLLLSTLVAILAISAILTASAAAWMSYDLTAGLPKRDAINGLGDMAQSTTVFDAKDRQAFTIFKEQRIELPLEKMSPNLIKAVISVEDQRFYQHAGVDAIRTVGAVVRNLEAGRRAEGGSTITQQLARLSFLTRGKTYSRKMKEIVLASYIESEYSKNDILQMYLNKAYFGDGLYGVEAAARGYLGKSASDLTVDEAALIAGLIQSPSAYAPTGNMERALARRAVVLQTMVSSGAIDAPTAERAKKIPVKLVNGLEVNESSGQYFKEAVRRELVDRFGWPRVSQGGLRVFTTLDIELQRSAEALVEKNLKDIEGRRGFTHASREKLPKVKEGETPDYLQGALFSMDPTNGYVLALVGGRDFTESRFNRAIQAFARANAELTDTATSVGRLMATIFPIVMFILNVSSVAVLWFGAWRIDAGDMQIGALTAFLTYLIQILMSVMMATFLLMIAPRAAVSAERIQEVLDSNSSVVPPQHPVDELPASGVVSFQDTEFTYPGAESPVLRKITFTAEPGQTTAIIGSTGAGKSTLISLIPRLFDATGGWVKVDGVEVRDCDPELLWSRIGLVPQKAFLFSGTVASNLRYGKPDATDEELWRALRVAQAENFVREMPGQLEAQISQGGTNVSGGQRQRLSIARALVKRPEIYVFDDSFSALDVATDARLRAALKRETAEAAVIIVGQRVATIADADKIIVLEHGEIVGCGTHEELLARCPTYVEIVDSQLSAEEAAA